MGSPDDADPQKTNVVQKAAPNQLGILDRLGNAIFDFIFLDAYDQLLLHKKRQDVQP